MPNPISRSAGLTRRAAGLLGFLLLAGSSSFGQRGQHPATPADSASTNFLLGLQRRVSPADTLALDTLRVRVAVRHVDSLVHVAQVAAARQQQAEERADSLRFLGYVRSLERVLRANGALPAGGPDFRLESTGPNAAVLRPADQLQLTIPEEYEALFQQLSRSSVPINANLRTRRLSVSYVYRNAMLYMPARSSFDSGVVAVLDAAAITEEQRRREAAFRPRNAAALKSLEVLYDQFYRLGKRPRFTKKQYSDFEKANFFTEEARFTFRTQCIRQLAADLAKL